MSLACLVFAAFLSANTCPPNPPDVVIQLGEATLLRPHIEKSIAVANEVLQAADESFRVVASWQLNGRGLSDDEIVIYLIKSPASARLLVQERQELEEIISTISTDFEGIAEGSDECSDIHECVEALYPETTVNLVMKALNRQNRWELAKTSPECRCIILIEQDLLLYRIVFGANWDKYILLTRFDSAEEFRTALAANRIPHDLLDGESVPLEAMVAFLLLHEIGHLTKESLQILTSENADMKAFFSGMDAEQLEELRADAFVARALAARCFEKKPTGLSMLTCTTPPALSTLTFVVGMKGKSKDARCLRYLDTVAGYPNWEARLLLLNYQYLPDSHGGQSGLITYLSARQELLKQPWIRESEICRRAVPLSLRK
ncbi:hypothetical protein ACDY96_34330 [Rhizobium mongolense]|uniref:hypothetical protein n=1 Tax=Rhizobium TaxID=379 RepID=UPI0024B079B0|nr:hypothetical protein [Rhizobium sp. CC1099]WFU90228.1 hypothetical protein QA644_29995 [Rhizobium sp. CC1099]